MIARTLPICLLALASLAAAEPPRTVERPAREAAPVPHVGPPVYCEVEIDDRHVAFRFTGEQSTLLRWLRTPDERAAAGDAEPELLAPPLTPAQITDLRTRIIAFFAAHNRLTVDDQPFDWTLGDIGIPPDEVTGYGVPALTFTLSAPRSSAPRSIGVIWEVYDRLVYFEKERLPMLFKAFGDAQLVFLSPDEPGFVWHASSMVPPEPPLVVEVKAAPPPEWTLPLVSLGAGALVLVMIPLVLLRAVGHATFGIALLVLGGVAWFGRHAWVERVPDPFAEPVVVPSEPEALALFEQLHRNIYRAFDARSEQEIYRLLAKSVTGNLLDELYGEVFESLVMRGEGGAVCKVEGYRKVSGSVNLDPERGPWDDIPEVLADRPRFDVQWAWEVRGVVSHWGHEHRRLNRYEATYIVVHDGEAWRIADVDVLEHERIDSPRPGDVREEDQASAGADASTGAGGEPGDGR
ncbi:MAG: hypothetical protein IPM29_00120 [Planctomycetes bacterium]|nr:hypothetical protein [Planctomycetota bacterium]